MNMQSVMKLLIRYVDSRTCKGTLQVKYDIDSCVVDFIPVTPYIRSDYVETTFMRKTQEEWVYDISSCVVILLFRRLIGRSSCIRR